MIGKKRGQITVFIIIGLIVLLTYLLLFHYRRESIEDTELIQPELIPVQQYVESCTKNLAREAINIIGLNGGYITFPGWIDNDPSTYLRLNPGDEFKNPYWRYDGKTAVPSLGFIENQMEDYVEERIESCIDNFSAFHNQFNIIELGNFDVIVEIQEEDVMVRTIYPIEVQDKFNKTLSELQKYIIVIPIRLKEVHELASKIIEAENRDYFVETKVIDLLSLDDDEIPTAGISYGCSKERWELDKVEDKLKLLMQINLPYIKIKNTNFDEDAKITPYQLQDTNPFSESDRYSDSYYGMHYIWDISQATYPSMRVSFNYDPKWDLMMYARPNDGKYLESSPQQVGGVVNLCMHIWHFTYDLLFPVKVTIVDDETDNNERYVFQFAFKGQINHNKPDRRNSPITYFETSNTYLEEEYCADVTNEITVHVSDKITSEGISGANLSFTCGRYRCDIGYTESDFSSGGLPVLRKRFPYCSNGILRSTKEGYEEGEMFIGTGRDLIRDPDGNLHIGKTFYLDMTPIKEFNVDVVKHKMVDGVVGGDIRLEGDERAIITVKREGFENYATYSINNSEESFPLKLLVPSRYDNFNYDLEIYVSDNESIKAGYKGEWEPSSDSISSGENITFHVIEAELESDEERYLFLAGLSSYSDKVYLPEIK
ncbi:MAG: hypothetical protein U9O94_11800 [Nanoarchaeota archaeon]|nr:hypothetical protein [Nanoarchaeota archaeon]